MLMEIDDKYYDIGWIDPEDIADIMLDAAMESGLDASNYIYLNDKNDNSVEIADFAAVLFTIMESRVRKIITHDHETEVSLDRKE